MAHKTRKSRKSSVMTIPELRRGFEHIETFAQQLATAVLTKKKSMADASDEYAKEWKRTFHRVLPAKSARASVELALAHAPRKGLRAMKGGMAPVSATDTQPGIYSAPTLPGQVDAGGYTLYAQVPNYVQSGFNAVTWQPSHQTLCGIENTTPMLAANLGSNAVSPAGSAGALAIRGGRRGTRRARSTRRRQKGGNASLALAFRPIIATNPTTISHDAQMAWKGLPPPASPDPTDPAFNYKMPSVPNVTDIMAMGPITRNIPASDLNLS
jgi:hypothetical protein